MLPCLPVSLNSAVCVRRRSEMADNSRAINRIFTRKVICDLIQNGKSDVFDYVVRRYINEPEGKSHGELVSEIYAHLGKQQRNEYYYMNTLLNKLLVGIHNVNTTTALSQIHIGHLLSYFISQMRLIVGLPCQRYPAAGSPGRPPDSRCPRTCCGSSGSRCRLRCRPGRRSRCGGRYPRTAR